MTVHLLSSTVLLNPALYLMELGTQLGSISAARGQCAALHDKGPEAGCEQIGR